MTEFPPINRLGYSLDMLTVTPLSIKVVDQSIKKARRIIDIDPDERCRDVTIGGQTYSVPRIIGVSTDISHFEGSYLTYRTGSEASAAFQADASLGIRYLCVSGSVSASYAMQRSLRRENQHAFYSFNADLFSASLRDYVDSINEKALKLRVAQLPTPFDGSKPDHRKEYRDFFSSFGTHVIKYCTYGARCQLNVWASNSDSSVNEKFSANVNASYSGVFNAELSLDVKKEAQYKTFEEYKQADVTCQGGDLDKGTFFVTNPDSRQAYDDWVASTASNPNVTSFSTEEIWSLLRDASAQELRDIANELEHAFNHLKDHPEIHHTKVTLTIESDWAEFGLLTPSAVIIKDTDSPPPDNTVFSQTKVQWGKEFSHVYRQQDVRFIIVNDGSPVDFYISHGSNGGQQGKGRASVVMEEGLYENKEITDNNWNTVWFYQKHVSPITIQAEVTSSNKPRTWHDTLDTHLKTL
ncbi:hypothetical protein K435DRAFT_809971 [Dendrothele bispora CBS 962.96]|uniref:MACPF domain-containing protein n=1 Tax=Dendrothele bispora (strain CBS 962.96) TaxID=1314807 RepID=A0A4V4HBQ5_DENBC|nr:hypothetical protein K435DRAFT_809971 [Dendrothele bispora CBS 962.96]